MGFSQLSLFTVQWSQEIQFGFQGTSFGVFMYLLKWVFLAWEASWGKVLTLDQLKRRGWTLAHRCFFCLVEEESTNHILIHCTKTRVLWELVFVLFVVT